MAASRTRRREPSEGALRFIVCSREKRECATMSLLESVKKTAERLTGLRRPSAERLTELLLDVRVLGFHPVYEAVAAIYTGAARLVVDHEGDLTAIADQ